MGQRVAVHHAVGQAAMRFVTEIRNRSDRKTPKRPVIFFEVLNLRVVVGVDAHRGIVVRIVLPDVTIMAEQKMISRTPLHDVTTRARLVPLT